VPRAGLLIWMELLQRVVRRRSRWRMRGGRRRTPKVVWRFAAAGGCLGVLCRGRSRRAVI